MGFGIKLNDEVSRWQEELIRSVMNKLAKLSDENLREVLDFIEFQFNKMEEKELMAGIQQLAADSVSFKFLEDEEDLYSIKDLKEFYRRKP